MNLNQLRDEATRIGTEHGFTDATPGEDLMLMVTEIAEAMEDYRNGHSLTEVWYEPNDPLPKPCGIPSEISDVIIRALHFCGKHEIDIETMVTEKMKYNDSRPFKHGGKKI